MRWLDFARHSWLDFLFPLRADERAVRDISEDDFLALVVPRIVPATRPGTVVLLPFNDQRVRALIHEAKYRAIRAHTNCSARRSLNICAMPMVSLRNQSSSCRYRSARSGKKERGFNQAEEIANRAAKLLGGAVVVNASLLIRTRETISQVSLPRHKREKNMHNAFGTMRSLNPSHTYIILDDVLTTGATLQAAIDALKKAGAEHIISLALAH